MTYLSKSARLIMPLHLYVINYKTYDATQMPHNLSVNML